MSEIRNQISNENLKLIANTIRILSAESIQKANSGHPGMPMGMADAASVLWCEFLNHNPDNPDWINRDRFVLSAGHGSMLLYSLLHLSGYEVTLDELKSFRQWGSRTAGHPEHGLLPGVETTTGPLGQGFGNGVGMAIAAKMMNSRFNSADNILFDHFIYGIVSDGDLMEGVSHEAASIAGNMQLGNLIYLYDDNKITIEGSTELTFTEDIKKRFDAYGWHVLEINAHDYDQIREAIKAGQNESEKPTLIVCKSHIGFGSPNKVDSAEVHGSPLGAEELLLTKKNLAWSAEEAFFIPDKVKNLLAEVKASLIHRYNLWNEKFSEWCGKNKEQSELLSKYFNGWLPVNLSEELLNAAGNESNATRSLSGKVIQKIAEFVPNFIGGSADLAPSTNTYMKNFKSISNKNFNGRNFHFGIREHGMGSILNGISLYGSFKVFGATFFVFTDYMRPAIRLAALMELPVIYVFTHDSIFVGEDGPTHQPVEHLPVLRAIPNITVLRPADAVETAMSWVYALENKKNPVALILTRQKIEMKSKEKDFEPSDVLKGAYIVSREAAKPELIIAASGSELPLAFEAKEILQKSFSIRIVSIPSREIFERQNAKYKEMIFPENIPVVIIEAALTMGWGDLFRQRLLTIGINSFGASAPYQTLAEKFGLTGSNIAARINDWMK